MTQGKLSVANKAPGTATAGQQQANGEKKEAPAVPSAPPSYEEATSGEGLKAGAFPPAPTAVPLHPSWAYVDPSSSSRYDHGFPNGDQELFTTFSWDDQKVRRVFVRKVYTILLIQLLVTLSVVALFTFCDPVKDYVQANPGWYWASYAVFFATYLTLACCSGPRRHFPWNLILLTIFTLSMAYLTGMLSSYYNTTSVLLCLGITALVCLSVTLFSFQTKFDFTSCQGVLFVLLMTLFFSGLILAILLPFQYFLAFDTQLLMGNRRHSLSPEEYIFGALNIYLDIIYIFTFFLQLFGSNRE
ncbi:PREDICTED: protein lifeguard 2 isoform X2 [Galeopterus variegatus]|uniref:Protein lifeguard 2 n=1 Tax=Galeopterus variegatus TaxID=482537 RepID=A0ABM0RKL6_GALVR|nr:PREDICTED: protein lifeguard 2 isoform X2 [Galeopterus variegatus]